MSKQIKPCRLTSKAISVIRTSIGCCGSPCETLAAIFFIILWSRWIITSVICINDGGRLNKTFTFGANLASRHVSLNIAACFKIVRVWKSNWIVLYCQKIRPRIEINTICFLFFLILYRLYKKKTYISYRKMKIFTEFGKC